VASRGLFACDFENDDPVIVIDGCHVSLFRSVVAISERIWTPPETLRLWLMRVP